MSEPAEHPALEGRERAQRVLRVGDCTALGESAAVDAFPTELSAESLAGSLAASSPSAFDAAWVNCDHKTPVSVLLATLWPYLRPGALVVLVTPRRPRGLRGLRDRLLRRVTRRETPPPLEELCGALLAASAYDLRGSVGLDSAGAQWASGLVRERSPGD